MPSRRKRKKKEAVRQLQDPKEKELDEVENLHGLLDQMPVGRTKALEVEAPPVRLRRHAVKNGKPAEPASRAKSANFGTLQFADSSTEETAGRVTHAFTLIGREETIRPKQTSLPLGLPLDCQWFISRGTHGLRGATLALITQMEILASRLRGATLALPTLMTAHAS